MNDTTKTVYKSLSKEFKKSTIKWVKKANWSYEEEIPIKAIITSEPEDKLDKDRVKEFSERIRGNGKSPKPLIVVETSNGLELVDGHHKVFALLEEGVETFPGFIGRDAGDIGPWQGEMHKNKLKKK